MRLHAQGITVQFGGVIAVNQVSVTLQTGSICAVIGPNGSGKSTLFNAITGLVPLSQGHVAIDDQILTEEPLHKRVRKQMSRTFQTPRFDPAMSLRDAVLCGYYPRRRNSIVRTLFGWPSATREARLYQTDCERLLETFRLDRLAELPMGELSMGLIRLVDVARAMAAKPNFLLLDEPAAGLSSGEQKTLVDEIRRVAREGVGVLLVEHNFELVTRLAEHLTVLERGRVLLQGKPQEVSADPDFRRAYLGSDAAH